VSESQAANRFFLLNDLPVRGPDGDDILGTHEAAVSLANLIEASRDSTPFTVGIDAGWGMGKSSLMLQIQAELDQTDYIQPVWFNAWTAVGVDALNGLIKSVLVNLDENVLRSRLRKIMSRRQLLAAGRIALIIVASYFHLTRVVDEVWKRLSVDSHSRNEIRDQIAAMFEQWRMQTKRTPNGRMLVVFIDDLDRCSDEVVLEVCEAIKLYLDVPGIAFIVGCDQEILGRVVADTGQVPRNIAGTNYMEKIVQVTYCKPMPFDDQVSRLIDLYAQKSGTEKFFNASVKKIVIDRTDRNPRRIKRLINSFVLEYQLNPDWENFGAEALIVVILMRQFYADFYRVIANPNSQNIAAEFLDYLDIRSRFRLNKPPAEADRAYFESHNVRAPTATYSPDDLSRLEEQLPVTYPSLARDDEFASLLRSLSDRPDFDNLRHRLQRQQLVTVAPPPLSNLPGMRQGNDPHMAGLQVLWIDDNQKFNAADEIRLTGLGAVVETVPDGSAARERLREQRPDVLVSDISRGDSDTAGFDDLEAFRDEGLYEGPAIFFTGRVTPARKRRAENLGARITNTSDSLVEFLGSVDLDRAATSVPAPRPVDQPETGVTWPRSKGLSRAARWSSGER
jgi:CheY-like chemotaxis protein